MAYESSEDLSLNKPMSWARQKSRKSDEQKAAEHERMVQAGYSFVAPNMYVPRAHAMRYW